MKMTIVKPGNSNFAMGISQINKLGLNKLEELVGGQSLEDIKEKLQDENNEFEEFFFDFDDIDD